MRRSLLLPPLALLLVLLSAASALAGGWATAGLSSTPVGVLPGKPWDVDITVLQHGRTPLDGVTPIVQIRSGSVTREFTAKPTRKPGVYHAVVVFPRAGRWTYRVDDGFMGQLHTFPPVAIAAPTVAAPPSPASDGDGIATGWLWGAGGALLLALAVLAADRRRRDGVRPHAPEPAA